METHQFRRVLARRIIDARALALAAMILSLLPLAYYGYVSYSDLGKPDFSRALELQPEAMIIMLGTLGTSTIQFYEFRDRSAIVEALGRIRAGYDRGARGDDELGVGQGILFKFSGSKGYCFALPLTENLRELSPDTRKYLYGICARARIVKYSVDIDFSRERELSSR